MWQALTCLPGQHDLRYVAVAVLICVLGSRLSMRLLARVRRNTSKLPDALSGPARKD